MSKYESPSFTSRYNFYDGTTEQMKDLELFTKEGYVSMCIGNKHDFGYLYPVTSDVMGSWKHFNRSRNTLDARHRRETSPLVSRELDRSTTLHLCFLIALDIFLFQILWNPEEE